MLKEKFISNSEEETKNIINTQIEKIKNSNIIFLNGDLGSGKTFIVKEIAHSLGVKKELVKSPTYTYIQEHQTKNLTIYHIDLYRLEEYNEILATEIIELSEKKDTLILIEWPERLFTKEDFNKVLKIGITQIGETKREIEICI